MWKRKRRTPAGGNRRPGKLILENSLPDEKELRLQINAKLLEMALAGCLAEMKTHGNQKGMPVFPTLWVESMEIETTFPNPVHGFFQSYFFRRLKTKRQ